MEVQEYHQQLRGGEYMLPHEREQLRRLDSARSMLLVNGMLTKRMDIEVRRRLKVKQGCKV